MVSPFYKQETIYTCAAACVRMVLEKCQIVKSEKEFAKLLKVSRVRGTTTKNILNLAEKYKLNYIVNRRSTLDDLLEAQAKGYKIIILYYVPYYKNSHFAVFHKIEGEYIYFLDPRFGEEHKYKLKYFLRVWMSGYKGEVQIGRFFGVKKP